MANARTVKVFVSGKEALPDTLTLIESYPGFVLASGSPSAVSKLAKRVPVEDITSQFQLPAKHQPEKRRATAPSTGQHHYLVQFVGPIKPTWLRGVRRAGGELREPRDGFAYVVRGNAATIEKIRELRYVRWAGHLAHAMRLAPALRSGKGGKSPERQRLPRKQTLEGAYVLEFFGRDDRDKAGAAVRRAGGKLLAKGEKGAATLVVQLTGKPASVTKKLAALSRIHGVKRIRERAIKRTSNDVASRIMYATRDNASPNLRLTGKGETVAVCDTGIDSGDKASIHPDFFGRVRKISSYPITPDFKHEVYNPGADDGAADLADGHGTHVAGSVLGNGSAGSGVPGQAPIRGLAYEAKLVFQAIEQDMDWKIPYRFREPGRYILAGIPADLGPLFKEAYDAGARIHTNSWGGGDPGAYDDQCEQLDRFVWQHPDFCVLVAAGNDGTDNDADGEINPMSVTSPATAKNCITVGASENDRKGSFQQETYDAWWPHDYPVAPYKKNPMADDPSEVAAFSSRGPTVDGRVKPEVIAPGTFILSTRSTRLPTSAKGWEFYAPNRMYFYMGGTSMATPLTAGAVALLRQYFRKRRHVNRPSAALLKAALICGATRLEGYAPASAWLDNHQGFGRVNLDAVVAPRAPAKLDFVQVTQGLETGDLHELDISVKGSKAPLHLVLAYSDFPGETLINNLNLVVISPSGRRYTGNGPVKGTLQLDTTNNVEVVHIAKPAAGTWRVQVVASNVPQGPQPFAVVYTGQL